MMNEQLTKWRAAGVLALILILVIAGLITHAVLRRASSFAPRPGWYAVFLSNGQVYFGKISEENAERLVLREIYYLQLPSNNEQPQKNSNQDVSLLKLGNEIHGPEDYMEINREHVLFIEKLKDDGKVAKAIQAYK